MNLVKDVMTRAPRSLELGATVADAFLLLEEGHFHHVPIVVQGAVVGLVSDRELLARMPPPALGGSAAAQGRFARQLIDTVMVHRPATVQAHEPATVAIELMLAQGVGAVPVVDVCGVLVGIVTLVDVARVCLGLLSDQEVYSAVARFQSASPPAE